MVLDKFTLGTILKVMVAVLAILFQFVVWEECKRMVDKDKAHKE